MRSLIRAFASHLNILCVKQLTEHHLEFLSLIKGGCTVAQAHPSLHLSKCHIVGNHIPGFIQAGLSKIQ